jgi:cytochrome c oxidase assembly factor CtaG
MIKAHRSDSLNSGVFAFLADKFEDRCYYWEMLIVARKVLIMAIFLLFGQVVAMLLATFVTIFSICIHIAAQPFEDNGTNWTETFSLCAQCITLVAGPVFVVLVRIAQFLQRFSTLLHYSD